MSEDRKPVLSIECELGACRECCLPGICECECHGESPESHVLTLSVTCATVPATSQTWDVAPAVQPLSEIRRGDSPHERTVR